MGTLNCACINKDITKEQIVELKSTVNKSLQERENSQSFEAEVLPITTDGPISSTTQTRIQSIVRGYIARNSLGKKARTKSENPYRKQESDHVLKSSKTNESLDYFQEKLESRVSLGETGMTSKVNWEETIDKEETERAVLPDETVIIENIEDLQIQGNGQIKFSNGDTYIGELKDGEANGTGTLQYENGDVYQGEFLHNSKQGHGKEVLSNGTVYEGDFSDNLRDGNGTLTLSNGDYYTGEFKNGLVDGVASFASTSGTTYDGYWKEGKMHGRGKYKNNEGVYKGNFRNDAKCGYGRFVYADARVYEGSWKDGRMHGEGWFGNERYHRKGVWRNGRRIKWL